MVVSGQQEDIPSRSIFINEVVTLGGKIDELGSPLVWDTRTFGDDVDLLECSFDVLMYVGNANIGDFRGSIIHRIENLQTMASMVFLVSSVSKIQDSVTHLGSFLGVSVNASEMLLGVDIVDGNPRLGFILISTGIPASLYCGIFLIDCLEVTGCDSHVPVDCGEILGFQSDRVFGNKAENESCGRVCSFTFSSGIIR